MNRQTTLIILVVLISALCMQGCAQRPLPVLRVAHLCDPQLGFPTERDGEKSFDNQVDRLEQAVRKINELAPDMVVIAGDMVNDVQNEDAVVVFKEKIAHVKAPVLLTPGNHDLTDPVTTEGLERYRSRYDDDFRITECNGRCFISANSQFWRGASPEDSIRHDSLLRRALSTAKNKKQPIILLTHIPPYISSVDEADDYFNIPKTMRVDFLHLCDESGVFLWLAGHTHTTIQRSYLRLTILNGETTSVNFDNHPYGFRLLTIHPDQHIDWDFIEL